MTKARILQNYPPRMENVLLILHALQNSNPYNYLSKKDLGLVAAYLNATLATIYGIASYYTMFSLRPRGKHILRICRSPVCHLAGALDVSAELTRLLKIDLGETTTDRRYTLEASECLGQCDMAPAMMVDEVLYGNLTRKKIEVVIRRYGQPRRSATRGMG
jgi:NADH-quinone oxidoreductase subunit E